MNWEERLSKWADSMEKTVDKIGDFGVAEVPEYVRELIMWEIVSNLLCIGLCLFFIAMAASAARVVWIKTRGLISGTNQDDYNLAATCRAISLVVLLAAMCIGGTWIFWSIGSAAKAYYAPRVVIVEKIAALAKGSVKK